MLILNPALMKMKTTKTKSGIVIWRHKFNQLLHPLFVTFVCILFFFLISTERDEGTEKPYRNRMKKEGIKKAFLFVHQW